FSDVDIKDIAYNSARVKKGSCFVAIRGTRADGHQFINEACRAGAAAIVSDHPIRSLEGTCNIVVSDTSLALARISSEFFGNPSAMMRIMGITGTNGKTTITYIIESVLKCLKRDPGVIGTVNCRYKDVQLESQNTTPMSYDLHKLLSKMQKAAVKDVVMEVSSHALEQRRVEGIEFDAALFTNLSHDHLDYHDGLEGYFKAKSLLFSEFLPASSKKQKVAVANAFDPYGQKILAAAKRHKGIDTFSFGANSKADVFVEEFKALKGGSSLKIKSPWGTLGCFTSLKGDFNAQNIAAATALLGGLGVPLEKIKNGIELLDSVPGRLEEIRSPKGFSVFVDYAHTPDAIKKVSETLKNLTHGKLIIVFGCGGDRDRAKRPVMGNVAASLGDIVIVTSDNPRTEDPSKIISDILAGIKKSGLKTLGANGHGYLVEEDRKKAICCAIEKAQEGDIVLIAGKGHETYQIVGKEVRHFDDREEVRRCVNYGIENR
ncbi:MAG: UDP-N-acetylmuramoyl-L-alanyl-D-glutamate--2,6-diaminopimelate ligase, partial [Deltaproteobacteria bacterium]|nr:UDP-N-acetylmuramoyl-L-alanyl-D-glutamate--2,6-diaminopimelate ligase [Deltaproteobacteria bacterium]